MRIHRLKCNDCGIVTEKISRNNNGHEVASSFECPECGGSVKAMLLAPSVHCDIGPYIDSHLQKPFQTKTAMTESIKRRGLVMAS
ncbi:hypothetical protein [uncultured Paraglaciecola sp.]|uniref:hypothetical protein n=1 Tax=uncultured Paraglaciecola sp. TaxID=1765024 RepID=UPI002622FC8B|nr:hypothetical protein [uncultured Paraglaciecola sp.]